MSSWKTAIPVLIGLLAQGCGFLKDFTDSGYKRSMEAYVMRAADRMAQDEVLRKIAYEEPLGLGDSEEDEIYQKEAKRVFKKTGQAALKGAWKAFTDGTPLESIIEPTFKDEEGRTMTETLRMPVIDAPKRESKYRLGFMPVIRIGDEKGGGIRARNFSALALRGEDYWEYKANARFLGFRVAGEYVDNDEENNNYKLGIGKGPLSLSYSHEKENREFWIDLTHILK
jgi:hypothetical protein